MPVENVALVESFDDREVVGWVAVEPGAPPVSVELCINGHPVVTSWAIRLSRRAGDGEIRGFSLVLGDIWEFVGTTDQISLCVGGRPAPIAGRGMYITPHTDGFKSTDQLTAILSQGYVFGADGKLQRSKTIDREWQAAVLRLYTTLRRAVRSAISTELFFIYGTLLGVVRDGGFIGHDLNFDCAYMSSQAGGADAARELQHLAFALIDEGFRVRCTSTGLPVWDRAEDSARIDVYHLYFDDASTLQFPHGVATESAFTSEHWRGTREIEFMGTPSLVPDDDKAMVQHIYGPAWTSPDPGFDWGRERAQYANEGRLPAALVEEVYWADFYARTSYETGPSFCELVSLRERLPKTIVDIGCGDGRDSYAFARSGRQVTGLDRSHIAIRHASKKAGQLGLGDCVTFTPCDVGNAERLRAVLEQTRSVSSQVPVLYYARFSLHSIPKDIQRTLLDVIKQHARSGDWFAAEFRTDRDEANVKVHGDHYRRFQNGQDFKRRLVEDYEFSSILLEQEGNGLSPYKGEDPYLYRIIAQR